MNRIFISSVSVLCASFFFVVNDAIINYLTPLNVNFYHFVFYGTPIYLIPILYLVIRKKFKEKLRCKNYFIPLLRSFIFLPAPFIAFTSLKYISLPEYTILNMTAPVFGVLISIFYLKEKMNAYLFVSLLCGVAGVYAVVQPNFSNFNYYYLLVLLSAFLISINIMLVNRFHDIASPIGFFIYGGIFVHLLSAMLFFADPLALSANHLLLVIISSILINLAIFLMVYAFQYAQRFYGAVNCLIYIQIFWSVIIGIIVFDERLNALAFFGATLVVLSGIASIPAQHHQRNK